uniref:LEA_2 domain-containing protein n=1 Tax=Globodera pallida TaxID=36090 RepID=A0A183CCV1_GLOPA
MSGVRITPRNRFHVDIEFKFLSDNDGIFILSLEIAHHHTEANVRSLWRSDVYKFTLDQIHCSVCYTKIDLSPPPTSPGRTGTGLGTLFFKNRDRDLKNPEFLLPGPVQL